MKIVMQVKFDGTNGLDIDRMHPMLDFIKGEGEIKLGNNYYKAGTTFAVNSKHECFVVESNTWDEVKDAVNGIFKTTGEFTKRSPDTDVVSVVFDNALPQALDKALQLAFIHDLDRYSVDCQVMLNGYEQLRTKGWIGDGV
ncbi:hypothetical protein VPFG_00279 [Vibrio phage nt-1]|uniref:Uncharacterized protein n=1 Tax=Vibrio phage nt-1 TaxID=115992 RepID=R9TGP9_9CAUD|nr:hypothetical protein VPFG_00279 [Vibrio phage nt-1]AGN30278.2 hypothetical protein VPFG_00279 [Vibrio phage nt-1]